MFTDAVEDAREVHIESLELEADRRAVEGIRRLKFYQGQPLIDPETGKPYFEHIYSDVLLIFRLKALKPATYRDGYEEKQSDEEINRDIKAAIASLKATWERERASANGREN